MTPPLTRVYMVFSEQSECTASPPCRTRVCSHPRTTPIMVPDGRVASKPSGAQARATMLSKRGVYSEVYVATAEWSPLLTPDEQATLRISGPVALRKILDAKKREADKASGRPSRPKVKHAADTSRTGGVWNGVQNVWCVCGRSWTHRCSKLKTVMGKQPR